jgi:hypothetical protein
VASPPLGAVAVDGSRIYVARCQAGSAAPAATGTVEIARAAPDPFGPSAEPDATRAARCPAPGRPGRWTAVRELGRGYPLATPRLAVDADGAALAGWNGPAGAFHALRRPGGSFGPPVADGRGGFEAPLVALAAHDPVVASTGAGLQVSVGGERELLAGRGARALAGVAATGGGHVVVAWQRRGEVDAAIKAPGSRFGAPVRLAAAPRVPTGPSDPVPPMTEPLVEQFASPAVGIGADGRAVVAFARREPTAAGPYDLAIADAPPGGPFAVRSTGRASGRISALAVAAGPGTDLTSVWLRSDARVSVQALTGAGAPATLSTPGVAVEGGSLTLASTPGGRAIAIWVERDADRLAARVMVAERPGPGRPFGAPRALQTVQGRALGTGAALQADGAAAVLWTLRCPGGGQRTLAAVRPPRAAFGAPELVSGRAAFGVGGAIGVDARGRATAVWTRSPGAPNTSFGAVVASDRRRTR